jgi:plasmid stabilization system protein ParE
MAEVRLSARAARDLESIFEFVAQHDPNRALETVRDIREAVMVLARHPLIGRAVEEGRREIVVSHGRNSYVALYRWYPVSDSVLVLAVRSAREAGYSTD